MDEPQKRRWEVWLGLAGSLITCIGLLLGVWQFNAGENNRRQEAQNAETLRDTIAFKRQLWQEKLASYRKVTELAGRIIATTGEQQTLAYAEFLAAYWGAMILVEDPEVEQAMIAFKNEFADLQTGWNSNPDQLKVRAEQLATACRNSLATGTVDVAAADRAR